MNLLWNSLNQRIFAFYNDHPRARLIDGDRVEAAAFRSRNARIEWRAAEELADQPQVPGAGRAMRLRERPVHTVVVAYHYAAVCRLPLHEAALFLQNLCYGPNALLERCAGQTLRMLIDDTIGKPLQRVVDTVEWSEGRQLEWIELAYLVQKLHRQAVVAARKRLLALFCQSVEIVRTALRLALRRYLHEGIPFERSEMLPHCHRREPEGLGQRADGKGSASSEEGENLALGRLHPVPARGNARPLRGIEIISSVDSEHGLVKVKHFFTVYNVQTLTGERYFGRLMEHMC